ncbi:FAR1 DNA binding domain, Zinc finger, SWIM-type, MULE transposase domain, FHY3/FAR1 family [Artemisia annua]|uniref:FAR1 DNA binding domain, Zinc finger, SWIM-type, MULE transposase domain, FHY3/FAR1 family n=1 Tax=Artemisia annua TaxID=35608 RepID=A0A2U1KM71_ARTAN|nr:FAR1 DNA binding domain, Zinc finger, SWIM-type, MULE transposase domain, FHY3/FAR1 family [Artemisia annua]
MDANITPDIHTGILPVVRSFGIQETSPKGTTIHCIPDVDESIKPNMLKKGGFEVRKSAQGSNRHEISHKWIVCNKQGFLPGKKQENKNISSENGVDNNDDNKKQTRNRPTTRCGCEAKICLRLTRDKQYELYVFEEKHNHSLVHPDDRLYLKSMRKLNYSDKTLLVKMSSRNIGPNVGYNILAEIHGGFDKVGHSISTSGFKKKISKIIWTDRLDPADFDEKWTSIVNEFHLEDNRWLSDMFELRHKWIPAYFRDTPLSGLMRTTSRSESENHMFGRLLNSDLTFVEFFSHFETAVQTQRFIQGKNDHDTRYTTPKTETTLAFEKEAMQIYTRKVFVKIVQKEMLVAVHSCYSIGAVYLDEPKTYTILDTDVRVKNFDDNGDEIKGGYDVIEVE